MDEVIYTTPIPGLFLQTACFSVLFLCLTPVAISHVKRRIDQISGLVWNIAGYVMVAVIIVVATLIINQKISEGVHRSVIIVGEKNIKTERTPKNAINYIYRILPAEINDPYFIVTDSIYEWISKGECYQFTYYGHPGKVEFNEITEIRHVEAKRCN